MRADPNTSDQKHDDFNTQLKQKMSELTHALRLSAEPIDVELLDRIFKRVIREYRLERKFFQDAGLKAIDDPKFKQRYFG